MTARATASSRGTVGLPVHRLASLSVLLYQVLATGALDALMVPVGVEFQVNSYTAGRQYLIEIAGSGTGEFVVTWTSSVQPGSGSVVGRLFGGGAEPIMMAT